MRRTVTALVLVLAVLPLGVGALAAPSIDTLELQGYSPEGMKLVYQLSDGDADIPVELDVTGPNGQVNHGSIISAFIRSLRANGIEGAIGCAVSTLAKTDLGRTEETKVRVPDAGTDVSVVVSAAEVPVVGDIDLSNIENRCITSGDTSSTDEDHGKPENPGTGHGKPDWAGRNAGTENPGRRRH